LIPSASGKKTTNLLPSLFYDCPHRMQGANG
jgi:hypothetical protein